MKKLTHQEIEDLMNGSTDPGAINSKERKRKKRKQNHIYTKEFK